MDSLKSCIARSFEEAVDLSSSYLRDETVHHLVEHVSLHLATAFDQGHKALICGNGGSACDAMHFAEEFTGRYRSNRRALPVISLTDSSHITCVGNDYGFESIFSRGVEAYGQPGDVFFGLSTSGNSANIIRALEAAQERGLYTVLLLGKEGGSLKGRADVEFIVPAKTADRIQEIHMTLLHVVIEIVERHLFPDLYLD